ncbi:MAG: carbohydrate ABC transporter permease, partial [Eubacteriales bacterium]|nr:carbohydrate ABC transporter permease [Eubacteriales bacterium]
LYWLLTFSLKDNTEIFGGNIAGLPNNWLFANYESALIGGKVGIYLLNSVIVTAITIIVTCLFSLMASYALTRMKWRGQKIVLEFFLLGLMIPIHATLLPLFLVLSKMHLISTHLALILPYTGFAIPMGIMIITGFIEGIPHELEEAGCIDGASIYQIFFRIILPILMPAISTVMIFTFLQSWNELLFAQVFISKEAFKTLTAGIQSMYGQYQTDWGPIGAALVVATFPTLAIYLAMSGQVQKSLAAGAVKG